MKREQLVVCNRAGWQYPISQIARIIAKDELNLSLRQSMRICGGLQTDTVHLIVFTQKRHRQFMTIEQVGDHQGWVCARIADSLVR